MVGQSSLIGLWKSSPSLAHNRGIAPDGASGSLHLLLSRFCFPFSQRGTHVSQQIGKARVKVKAISGASPAELPGHGIALCGSGNSTKVTLLPCCSPSDTRKNELGSGAVWTALRRT